MAGFADERARIRALEAEIKRRIAQDGPLTFAEFMRLALYTPELGYYASARQHSGGQGDYYTSPQAHPVFGALLSRQLAQMWELLDAPADFTLVEMGGGEGLLCGDILAYAKEARPDFYRALKYLIVEVAPPSCTATSSLWSRPGAPPDQVAWLVSRGEGLPVGEIVGCILSNEFFDALPVHLVVWSGSRLREIFVTWEGNRFTEVWGEPSTPELAAYFDRLGMGLAEGQRAEVRLEALRWVRRMGAALRKGLVLTIDYGGTAEELFAPGRRQGTLRCYYQHAPAPNPYARVGAQDITASVDFTSLMAAGEQEGLQPMGFTTQRDFLRNLGLEVFIAALARAGLHQDDYQANRYAMLELARTGGLGDFRVLIQHKGLPYLELDGLNPQNRGRDTLLGDLTSRRVPLLTPAHASLLRARYPHQMVDFSHLWEDCTSVTL